MDDDGNGIAGDHILNWFNPLGFCVLNFLRFDLPGGIGNIDSVVDQGCDAGSRSSSSYRNADIAELFLIEFRPGQR